MSALGGAASDLRSAYLHPGELLACRDPTVITTLLGSCVALCLWDPAARIGGMSHYLLPYWSGEGPTSARFGNVAIRRLLDAVLALGAQRTTLAAKLFGGACVLEGAVTDAGMHLGARNVDRATTLLASENVPVVAADTGGRRGRKVVFHTDDGTVWVKTI